MRIYKQFFKSIVITALMFTGFTAGSIAQDTNNIVNPESKAPAILTISPTGGETNVDLSSVIEITFSSEMDETTINENTLMLYATSANAIHEEQGEMRRDQIRERSENEYSDKNWQGTVYGTISYSNKVAVFTPDEDLKEGTLYTFTITNGVKNLENVALNEEQSISFTTSDTSELTYSAENGDRYGMDRNVYREGNEDNKLNKNKNMVDLGKAGQFVILAKSDINNESESNITGHTGEGSVADKVKKEKDYTASERQRTSKEEAKVLQSNQSDTTAPDVSEAIEDMITAYSSVSSQNGDKAQHGDDRGYDDNENRNQNREQDGDDVTTHKDDHIPDEELKPGVHQWSNALNVHPDFTLTGSEEDVWIFKVGGDLTIDEDFVLTLSEGAQADNVFWYVEGKVTIGKNAQFEGVILSMSDITLEKGAKVNGRMFSQASVSLDDNTVTEPRNMAGRTTSTNRDEK